jgi:hypothetical protein
MNAARQACASLRPAGGFGGGFANNPANQAYFQCLQQHGVTFPSGPPTTVAGSTASTGGGRPGFANDPATQAALKACASLRPQRPNGTTTTTG